MCLSIGMPEEHLLSSGPMAMVSQQFQVIGEVIDIQPELDQMSTVDPEQYVRLEFGYGLSGPDQYE